MQPPDPPAGARGPGPPSGGEGACAASELTLLYDGDCPICSREARWLRRRTRNGRLAFDNIAEPSFDPAAYGLTRAEVDGALHAVRPDGRVLRGMAAVRGAYRAVGLGWLTAPTDWPVLRPLFDAAYRWFARHRIRIGRWLGRR